MNVRSAAALAALLLLTACNASGDLSPQAGSQTPPFDAKEAAFINASGATAIDGHAFMVEPSGKVRYASGEMVELIPATAYARARFSMLYGDSRLHRFSLFAPKPPAADPEYLRLMRMTRAESTGRFRFDHVAPGTYFVATQVSWKKSGDLVPNGGAIYETVTVTGKETKAIHLVMTGR